MSEEKQAEAGLEDANWGDSSGKGLTAGLDKFFGEEDEAKLELAPEPEEVEEVEEAEEAESVEEAVEPDTEEEAEPVMDEDFFPSDDEETKEKEEATEGFDDKEFEEQTEALTEGMEAKPGEKFKELRNELKEFKKKSLETVVPEATLQEISDLKLKLQEQEGLQTRFDEMASKSAKLQVESSPIYDKEILRPVGQLFAKADAIAKAYEIDPSHVRAIIKEGDDSKRDAMVEEFLDGVPAYNQARIINSSEEYSDILQKREDMIENADAVINKSQVDNIENEQRILKEQREATQTIQSDIFEKYKDTIPGFMKDGKETELFKKMKSKGLSVDFGKARARDQALAAFSGTVLPHAMSQIVALQKELKAYRDEDASYQKRSPSSGSSVKASTAKKKQSTGFMADFLNADFG